MIKRVEFDIHGLKIKPLSCGGWRLVKTGRRFNYKRDAVNAALDLRFPYKFTGIPIRS